MRNSTRLDIWIDKGQKITLENIREADGIPISEQVRRAIKKYIEDYRNDYRRKLATIKETSQD